jgi:phosphohistidine phosphatase
VGPLRLTLLRHGQAQPIESCAVDYERALTRRGANEAQEMGGRLVRRGLVPDLILASPAERTWTTASIVAGACDIDPKSLRGARELYLASPESIWQLLCRRNWAAHHVLICGHNPGLSQVASRFGPSPGARDLPTAGLVTAQWRHAAWVTLQPEAADACDLDDPESMDHGP